MNTRTSKTVDGEKYLPFAGSSPGWWLLYNRPNAADEISAFVDKHRAVLENAYFKSASYEESEADGASRLIRDVIFENGLSAEVDVDFLVKTIAIEMSRESEGCWSNFPKYLENLIDSKPEVDQ